jgi:hypothetical protein
MLPYRDSYITRVVLGIFFLIVIAYAYFEARGLLFGPTISISSQSTLVQSPYVLIQGQTTHIDSLTVDGQPISVTVTGGFQEPYVLAPGINRIVFDAKDAYGNKTEKVIEIDYVLSATSTAVAATTTPQTTSSTTTATSTGSGQEAQ